MNSLVVVLPREAREVSLPAHRLLRVEAGEASGVEVVSGTLWVTGTPASGDHLLRPRDRYRFAGAYPYLLEALSGAVIVLEP